MCDKITGTSLEAHGELRNAEGHEQRLVRVAVGKVRADAYDGRELGTVQGVDLVPDDLPEGLPLGHHRAHRHGLVACWGGGGTPCATCSNLV